MCIPATRARIASALGITGEHEIVENPPAFTQFVERGAQLPAIERGPAARGEGAHFEGDCRICRVVVMAHIGCGGIITATCPRPGVDIRLCPLLRISRPCFQRDLAAPDCLDGAHTLALENALNALDRVAFGIEQAADALEQIDIARTIIAPPARPLERFDLRESCFPEAQHMLGQVEILSDFADGTKSVRTLFHCASLPPDQTTPSFATRGEPARAHSPSESLSPLILAFITLEGLKTMTRRGSIGTSTPVFGLRPIRSPFSRTTKDPKEDSFTVSPCSSVSQISPSTDSTNWADSVRESPTR